MTAGASAAVEAYPPRAYTATPLAGAAERHMLNRIGTGFTPAALAQLRAAGGPMAWFERQLDPDSIAEPPIIAEIDDWMPGRLESYATRWQRHTSGAMSGWEYCLELGNWSMLRRMFSARQLYENMVDFWGQHFHVIGYADKAWVPRAGLDRVVRRHALGRFDDLLAGVTLHPAMLLYLDNHRSIRNAPNENHGRELLELHTVGHGAGYTEEMVRDSAIILSGWRVRDTSSWAAWYDTTRHTTGPVTVLGFSRANGSSDGRAVCAAYLRYLAHHPETARSLAHRLAVRFIGDEPSDDLVERIAQAYLAADTDIAATLRALVASPEFAASAGAKVRTPIDDLVATARVLRVRPYRPTGTASFAHGISFLHGGEQLFTWPRPDGPPLSNPAWCSVSRMLASFRMHWMIAGRHWPNRDVACKAPASWLPEPRLRFDSYVDHLSRVLLGRRSTSTSLTACCEATGVLPGTIVHRDHPVAGSLFPRLICALLDSPAHLTR